MEQIGALSLSFTITGPISLSNLTLNGPSSPTDNTTLLFSTTSPTNQSTKMHQDSLLHDLHKIPLKLRLIIILIVKIIYEVSDFHYMLQFGLTGETIQYPILVALNLAQIIALRFEVLFVLRMFQFYLAVITAAFLIATPLLLFIIVFEPNYGILNVIRSILRHGSLNDLGFWNKIGYFVYAQSAVLFMTTVLLAQLFLLNAVIWEIEHRKMVKKCRRLATSRISVLEDRQNQNQNQNASRMVVDDVEKNQNQKDNKMNKNRSQNTDITSIDI